MAEAVIAFLLTDLKDSVVYEINQFKEGEEKVRWIENEKEMIIPLLERIEGMKELRQAIDKSDVLVQIHSKRMIQMRTATIYLPLYATKLWRITKQLSKVKDQIARNSAELLQMVKQEQDGRGPANQSFPSYLRRCIHYFQLFPLNFRIPARRLIFLWVAEGLVHSSKYASESAEEVAERYLKELIELEVLDVERKRNGKVSTCKINVIKRDKLLMGNANSAARSNISRDNDQIRWLVDSTDDVSIRSDISFIQIQDNTEPNKQYRDVISFLSFNAKEGSKPGKDIGDFLRKCISAGYYKWLRVLDLERVFRPKLPKTLAKLIGLKYLGLRWTYLEQLPNFVNELLNLQVLDVKRTYISVLPTSIWAMEYLRHLYLSEAYRTRFPDPPSRITLAALQTLWGAFVDEDTRVENGLDTLLNIRKLGLSCRSSTSTLDQMSEQLKAIANWISKLKLLESLRLKSQDERGNAAHLHLTSLEGNRNLSTVYLLGRLDGFILWKLPVSLTDVTLSGSELDVDPMPFLGRLPNLVSLGLLAKSVVCSKIYCLRRGFRSLRYLRIWKLENLEEFEAEEGSLPCLEELEVRSCNKLEKLPDRLRRLENFEIKLTNMPTEFVLKEKANYPTVCADPDIPTNESLGFFSSGLF